MSAFSVNEQAGFYWAGKVADGTTARSFHLPEISLVWQEALFCLFNFFSL